MFAACEQCEINYNQILAIKNVISALNKYKNMYHKEYRHHMDHKRYLDRANACIQELTKEHLAECELLPMNMETRHFGGRYGKNIYRALEFFNYLLSLPENEMRGILFDHKMVAVTKDKVVPESRIHDIFHNKITNLKGSYTDDMLKAEFIKLRDELLK